MLNSVKVPAEFEAVFEKAQEYVDTYFSEVKRDPSKGTVEIFGERYILVRAASMSIDFFELIESLYKNKGGRGGGDIARQLLYDIAHAIGIQDARSFHRKMNVKDPVERLSIGPLHFSHSGWAFVDILPESTPTPDKNYYLIYDHPFSFESDAWQKSGKKSSVPVCAMNAGYSSGWCEESFGVALVASEIMCKAKGDDCCRFIMAHPSKIQERIDKYVEQKGVAAGRMVNYEVPGFFDRKLIERELFLSGEILKNIAEGIYFVRLKDGIIVYANPKFEAMFGYNPGEMVGREVSIINAPTDKTPEETRDEIIAEMKKTGEWHGEIQNIKKDGTLFWCWANCSAFNHPEHGRVVVSVHMDITESKKTNDELKKKLHDLEVFYRAATDREKRILELKKRVRELEGKTAARD